MKLADLRRLVAQGESATLEFKRTTGELREGLKTVCGFLNTAGGHVLFGVDWKGAIAGQQVSEQTLHEITAAFQHFEPPAVIQLERTEVTPGREVIALAVEPNPGAVSYTFDGRGFVREGNTTRRMRHEEYERLLLERLHARHRWENLPAAGWKIGDLDADEIRQTVADAVAARRLAATPSERLRTVVGRLGLLANGVPTQAAVVLFGKDPLPDYPQCAIRLARFRGTTKSEFLDNRQFHGHAFELLRRAEAFLDMHLPIASRVLPGRMRREDRPQYPPEALREALVNALCHRDYSQAGASIGVAIFDDRLEVWSYGQLPGGLTPERLRVDHPSVRRNELIAEVFYRRGLIEKWGRGTQRILELCRGADLSEPEFVERMGELGVVFRPAFGVETLRAVPAGLTERQLRILELITRSGPCRLAEIVAPLGGKLSERTVQRDLDVLRRRGLVALEGVGRGARYTAMSGGA